jgi:hypothetical protein
MLTLLVLECLLTELFLRFGHERRYPAAALRCALMNDSPGMSTRVF